MSDTEPSVIANPWQALRQFTQARIALGRSGVSLPTAAQLEFQLAHARARDAVHLALDAPALAASLAGLGLPSLTLHSAAADRNTYLQRPDLGRRLDAPSRAALEQAAVEQAAVEPPALKQPAVERSVMKQPGAAAQAGAPAGGYDLALLVADGLSALAIEQNVLPFLTALLARLSLETWSLAPLAIVEQGRVAIGDEVGQVVGARAVLVLIGERPGLSSPDSMGLYLTWSPRVGLLDDSRNCISNVRPAGLSYEDAAYKMHYLLSEARRRGLSGVALKDETPGQEAALDGAPRNFLIG